MSCIWHHMKLRLRPGAVEVPAEPFEDLLAQFLLVLMEKNREQTANCMKFNENQRILVFLL